MLCMSRAQACAVRLKRFAAAHLTTVQVPWWGLEPHAICCICRKEENKGRPAPRPPTVLRIATFLL